MPLTHILLVSSHPPRESRLASWLEARPDFHLIGVVGSLRKATEHTDAGLLLVDMATPDTADELCWAALQFSHSLTPIVVLFDRYNKALRLAAAAGARGFLPGDAGEADLVRCLREVLRGIPIIPDVHFFERLWAPWMGPGHASESRGQSAPMIEPLTPRERDILQVLAEGATNREIAARLQLSEQSVRNRVSGILSKLGLRNRTQAAIWAHEHGLGGRR